MQLRSTLLCFFAVNQVFSTKATDKVIQAPTGARGGPMKCGNYVHISWDSSRLPPQTKCVNLAFVKTDSHFTGEIKIHKIYDCMWLWQMGQMALFPWNNPDLLHGTMKIKLGISSDDSDENQTEFYSDPFTLENYCGNPETDSKPKSMAVDHLDV